MKYIPEARKELEDLRDAIDAALRGEPVQMRDLSGEDGEWVTHDDIVFSGAIVRGGLRYRPVPKKVKLRYRRCVRQIDNELMIDTVTQHVRTIARIFTDPTVMETDPTFVRWLDDDWVEVEIEAPK